MTTASHPRPQPHRLQSRRRDRPDDPDVPALQLGCATTASPPEVDLTGWSPQTRDAVSSLDADSRLALALIYLHRHSEAQVAVRLGISPAQVRTRIADALVCLGDLLAPQTD